MVDAAVSVGVYCGGGSAGYSLTPICACRRSSSSTVEAVGVTVVAGVRKTLSAHDPCDASLCASCAAESLVLSESVVTGVSLEPCPASELVEEGNVS